MFKMKPTAVHLHLHYVNRWPEMRRYLQHLGDYPYHLYVTLTKENACLEKEIKDFHPHSTIWCTENRGYDIGPFVDFLHKIDLSQYDLVLKIHAKNKYGRQKTWINDRYITKRSWVNLLFTALLGSKRIWKKNVNAFLQDPQLGMLSSQYLITSEKICSEYLRPAIDQEMQKMGYQTPQNITFVAGTMFVARAKLLEKIKKYFSISDFAPTDVSVQDGTLAHVIERVLGCLIAVQGYEIKGFDKNWWVDYVPSMRQVARSFYSDDITSSNHRLIKVCKIPVYYKKVSRRGKNNV